MKWGERGNERKATSGRVQCTELAAHSGVQPAGLNRSFVPACPRASASSSADNHTAFELNDLPYVECLIVAGTQGEPSR